MRGRLGLIAVACALGGCGGQRAPGPAPAPTPTPRPPTDRERLQGLLQRRGDAVLAGRRVRGLGLTSASYAVDRMTIAGRRARLRVRLSYSVRGVHGDFGSLRTLRARRAHGRWRIARRQGARNLDPWEVDDYARRRTPHFVVWTPRGIDAPAAALEAGYARLAAVLEGGRLRRRYLVVVARDGDAARRLTERISGLESLTAITDTKARIEGPEERVAEIGSQRLIIVHKQFAAATAQDQQMVVTHELTHAALAPVTSGRVPSWLTEGVALYVSEDDRRPEYAARPTVPTLAALSAPDAIGRTIGDDQAAAYATASAAAYGIAERYGRERLLALYELFRRPSLHGRRGDPRLAERATRRVLGVGLRELQRSLDEGDA